jgi:hypothetical protein
MSVYNTWFEISTPAPRNKEIIIRLQHGKRTERRIAIYATKGFLEANDSWDEDLFYDEEKDEYYCPEGWYEKSHSNDDVCYWRIDDADRITHWMKIGEPA